MQISKDESGQLLKLAGKLDIGAAEELRNALRDFVSGGEPLTIDLSGVDECDTAALQLLYSARATAQAAGTPLAFEGTDGVVRETSGLIGLALLEEFQHAA